MQRRDFLKVASTSAVLGSLGLSKAETIGNNKSVIFIFLAGGISHYEFTSPNPNSPEAYRSITGIANTNIPGIEIGGNYKKLATIADKFSIVRGFGHNDASHGMATHEILTGSVRVDRSTDNATPDFPSIGSVVSSYFGSNSIGGMPSYIGTGRVYSDGPSWIGSNFGPYENSGQAVDNLKIKVEKDRYNSRKSLSSLLPDYNLITRNDNSRIDKFQEQVYDMLEGGLQNKFNIELESEETRLKYGKNYLGNQLLMARRLVENGSKFILSTQGSWDFHENIKQSHDMKDPETDQAIFALISDLYERGLDKSTLVIISTEFGRTKINVNPKPGRDHQPGVVPLILSGGGYYHGKIIGNHDKNGLHTISGKSGPKDVNATIFSFLGIPDRLQALDHSGRPRDLLPAGAKSIL